MLLNLFRYVLILWSMNVFLLTYFGHRFHPMLVILSEKANFATYCSGFIFLARSLILFTSNLGDREIFEFDDFMSSRSPFCHFEA